MNFQFAFETQQWFSNTLPCPASSPEYKSRRKQHLIVKISYPSTEEKATATNSNYDGTEHKLTHA